MGVSEINKIKHDLKHYLNITINEMKHEMKHESIMCKVEYNIHGGNNLIAPNSTNATQTIYANADNKANQYDQAEVVSPLPDAEEETLSELARLSINIDKVRLQEYLAQIAECRSATELAMVVVRMAEQEPRLTVEEIVKERFISQLLPFATNISKGTSIGNVRQRINDALARRPRNR